MCPPEQAQSNSGRGNGTGLSRRQKFLNTGFIRLDACWGGDGNTINASYHSKQEGNETFWKSLNGKFYVNL